MTLRKQVFSAFRWTTFSSIVVTIVQFSQLAILARFLDPNDFGLMALAMVVIGFSQAFVDMGISNAIIQKQEITQEQLSTLYWLNIFAGIAVYAIIVFIAPLISHFYHDKNLITILMLVGLTFVIQPFGQQFRIIMQKELNFNLIAKIEVATSLVGLSVASGLAVYNFGVYSIVYATLTAALFSTIWFFILGCRIHRLHFYFKPSEVKSFIGFGAYQMGEKSINYMSTHIDKILIGRFLGMEALGFYNLAWQLIMFPVLKINPILNLVSFPFYSKIQHDKAEMAKYYSFSIHALSLLIVPILMFMGFFAHDVISVVYGNGWEQAATLISILSAVGTMKALGNPGGAVLLALGRAEIGFWWNLIWSSILTLSLGISLMLFPDIRATAYTLLVLSLLFGSFWFSIVFRISTAKALPTLKPVFTIITVVFLLLVGISYLLKWLPLFSPVIRLIFIGTVGGITYLTYVYLFERKVWEKIKSRGI